MDRGQIWQTAVIIYREKGARNTKGRETMRAHSGRKAALLMAITVESALATGGGATVLPHTTLPASTNNYMGILISSHRVDELHHAMHTQWWYQCTAPSVKNKPFSTFWNIFLSDVIWDVMNVGLKADFEMLWICCWFYIKCSVVQSKSQSVNHHQCELEWPCFAQGGLSL